MKESEWGKRERKRGREEGKKGRKEARRKKLWVNILAPENKSHAEAKLTAKNRGITLIELNLTVPDEGIASSVCDNWLKSSAEIYAYLTEKLF